LSIVIDTTIGAGYGAQSTPHAFVLIDTYYPVLRVLFYGSGRAYLYAPGLTALDAGHSAVEFYPGGMDRFDAGEAGYTLPFFSGTRLFAETAVRRASVIINL